MNVLLIVGLVLAALIAIIYFWAAAKCYPKTCLFTFIAAFALILALLVAVALPPRMDDMQVTYVSGNNISLFDGRGGTINLDITKIPHVSADYVPGMKVQLTRDTLGNLLFLSPQEGLILPNG